MIFFSTIADCWLGLCRKAPEIRTVSPGIPGIIGNSNTPQPDAGRNTGRRGSIRQGISIAAGSIRALFREKTLFGFSVLSGLVILLMIAAERWNLTHMGPSYAASSLISIPLGSTYLIIFDLRIFLIEAVCLTGFTFVLAALTHYYRSAGKNPVPATFRSAIGVTYRYAGTLAGFSLALAFIATVLWEITAQNQITGTIESALTHTMFWLPYSYYFAPNGIFMTLFLSFRMIVVNTVLFLIALYVVPVILLENTGLFSALAKSFRLIQKTWREILGCTLVFGTIILAVTLIGLLIGQSPALVNYDYDFFLQVSRGQLIMMAACYGFLLACGVLMALGSTVLGIAVMDLYETGTGAGTNTPPGKGSFSTGVSVR